MSAPSFPLSTDAFVVAKSIKITDQPGRVLACFVIAPILAIKGVEYNDNFIKGFSILLFSWDLWWLVCKKPKEI